MVKNQKIRFAVVGAGHIGKRHAEMIRRDKEGELVAIVDIRSKKECAAEDFDVPFFNSIEGAAAYNPLFNCDFKNTKKKNK